ALWGRQNQRVAARDALYSVDDVFSELPMSVTIKSELNACRKRLPSTLERLRGLLRSPLLSPSSSPIRPGGQDGEWGGVCVGWEWDIYGFFGWTLTLRALEGDIYARRTRTGWKKGRDESTFRLR